MDELIAFFDIFMNVEGTLTYEAVHLDPETIELLGSRKSDDSSGMRLFGFTREISLLQTQIEVAIGKSLPRPKIPGLELRQQRHITKLHGSVAAAQKRSRDKNAS